MAITNNDFGLFSNSTGGGGGGGVSSVTGTAPISSSGGANPNISISQSSGSTNGFLSSTDWTTFNSKVGGSGTQNFLPKWSTTGTIGNSQIFDNGTNVGVGTSTPTSTFLLDVNTSALVKTYLQVGNFTVGSGQTGTIITNGLIQTSAGVNIAGVTGATFNKNGFYPQGNGVDVFCGNNLIANFNLTGNVAGTYTTLRGAFTINGGGLTTGTQNELNIFGNVNSTNVTNSVNVNQILINPTYSQGTFGTGTLRGIYYNPNLGGGLNTSVHNAWENTSGDIIFGNLKDNVNLTTQVALIDESGKVIRQSSKTSFQLFQSGATAVGIDIDFAASTFVFGNDISARAALRITTDEWSARYAAVNQGLLLDFGNLAYTFGQIDEGTLPNLFHKVDGTSNSELAYFQFQSNRIGYEFDFGLTTYKFGDFGGVYGDGSIQIDSTAETILIKGSQTAGSTTFEANALILTGANLDVPAGGGERRYLKITLNGVDYTIELTEIV